MTKKRQDTQTGNGFNSDATYAAVTLQEADQDAFSNWMTGVSKDFCEGLREVLEDSYRVTLKVDYTASCHMCTFTQQDAKHHNHNLIIVSRSDDPEEAFWLNVYKIYVLFEGQRLPTQDERKGWG
jgi:hypothetical protein